MEVTPEKIIDGRRGGIDYTATLRPVKNGSIATIIVNPRTP